jgi:nicotinamidase-related amidase
VSAKVEVSPVHLIRCFSLLLCALLPAVEAAADADTGDESSKPERSALIVVDAQVGVFAKLWESTRVADNIEQLVREARGSGVPIIWVQHSDTDTLKLGSEAWQLLPRLVPEPSERVLHKTFNSSFAGTDLDAQLRAQHVTRVVLAGAASNWCIRATAYAALDRGYNLTLVSDAHSTESIPASEGHAVAAEAIVAETNIAFQWLSAPGVSTEATPTAEVRF